MSAAFTGSLILGENDEPAPVINAHAYDSPISGPITIATVTVAGLTIQSHFPGALRRLADALNAAEDQADAIRSVAAAS